MNILFFLTPKQDVVYVNENDTLRAVLEKMEYHRYAVVPVLSNDGKYVGTLTEGDILFFIKNHSDLSLKETEKIKVHDIPMKNQYNAVGVSNSMESLLKRALSQNYVPVEDDLGHFIGIVRRRELMNYLYNKYYEDESELIDIDTLYGMTEDKRDFRFDISSPLTIYR